MGKNYVPGSFPLQPFPVDDDPGGIVPDDPTKPNRFSVPGPTTGIQLTGQSGGGATEIIVITTFPKPWASDAAEVQALNSKIWNPSDTDFLALANKDASGAKIFTVKTFGEFLGAIQSVSAKQLGRVNLITHGMATLISMSGSIISSSGVVMLNNNQSNSPLDGGMDIAALQAVRGDAQLTRDLRGRFSSKQAQIFVYACHSGVGVALLLLQEMADTFQATVRGFRDSIFYCPTFSATAVTDRTITGVGSCTGAQSGFRHLGPQQTAVP
jgi:hypothetical protein